MNKAEAEKLLTDFFASFGKAGFAFEQTNFVKATIGETVLGFEFRENKQILSCRALIYRFHNAPSSVVWREIKIAERNGAETGGGKVVFETKNSTLSLIRIYSKRSEPALFAAQMQKLAAASLVWSSIILDRIATKSNK